MASSHWPQEEDRVPPMWSLGLIIATVVMILVSIAWSWWLARRGSDDSPEAPRIRSETLRQRSVQGPVTIGGIRQTPIGEDRPAENLKRRKLQELETYGWVDRDRGIVHIPIDRAMDDVIAAESRANGAER
jgi:hypothetical protein